MAQEINRNTTKTIGTTAQIISEAINFPTNQRKVITIINVSSAGQIITVAIGDQANDNQGIVLSPGGYYQESHDAGFIPTQTHITAISDAANGAIAIQERIIVRGS